MPQANRRSWRIGQTEPVHVYYLAYDQTPQAEAMHRIAKKLAAAQALQGDIRQGLAELLGDDDFVTKLQSATVSTEHYESDLTLADLPPLEVFALPAARPVTVPRAVRPTPASTRVRPFEPAGWSQLGLFSA